MYRLGSRVAAGLILCILCGALSPAHAEERRSPTGAELKTFVSQINEGLNAPPPEGLRSCFDFYTFGSVRAVPGAELLSIAQGSPVVFSITLTNNNPYPVVNAGVYGKLFRSRGEKKDANGPDAISFFPIQKGVVLSAGETKVIRYEWNVPSDLEPGDYKLATYVAASDRFNLLGLSFTDDIVGDSFAFTIVGEDVGHIGFEKSSVTVAGEPFYFAAFPPRVPLNTDAIPVSATIENTTSNDAVVTVRWKAYSWDGLRESELFAETEQEITISADSTSTASFSVPVSDAHAMHFVTGEFTTASGNSSYIGVRFIRGTPQNAPRFNDVAVNAYPPVKGETMAFACFHSINTDHGSEEGRVVLEVHRSDPFGRVLSLIGLGTLARAEYAGPLLTPILALPAPFTSTATSFEVSAALYRNGELVDRVTVPYTCEELGAPCDPFSLPLLLATFLVLIIIIVGGTALLRIRRQNVSPVTPLSP
jgi:hypothetical protein